jgi:hypothetical protein
MEGVLKDQEALYERCEGKRRISGTEGSMLKSWGMGRYSICHGLLGV